MPIYEYQCTRCHEAFEQLVRSSSEERAVACPKCGERKLDRRPSVFAPRGSSSGSTSLPRAGCGRCGDPKGSCGLD